MQRDPRPVLGATEVVFQVHADEPERLFVQRVQMLIIAMRVVVGQAAVPVRGEFAGR